jgi:hypothetical protein
MDQNYKLSVRRNAKSINPASFAFPSFVLVLSLIVVGQVLFVANRGLDFTDEGWYLSWISNPGKYKFSVTQFSFVYHPIFILLNQDIALLRVFNIISLWGLSSLLAFLTFSDYPSFSARLGTWFKLPLALGVGSLSMAFFAPHWLMTPNYNSLNFLGILIAFIGTHFVKAEQKATIFWGVLVTALGIGLSFLAKPTSGAALGVAVALFFLIGRPSRLLVVASIAVSSLFFVLLFGVLVDGSIVRFFDRYVGGAKIAGQQDPRYTLGQVFRFDTFIPSIKDGVTFLALFISVLLLIKKMSAPTFRVSTTILGTLILGFTLVFAVWDTSAFYGLSYSHKNNLVLLAPCLALAFAAIRNAKNRVLIFSAVRIPWLLLFAPLIMSLGTNGNYWFIMSLAVIFWILAGFEIIMGMSSKDASNHRGIAITLAITQMVTLIFLVNGALAPYRNDQGLRGQHTSVELGPGKSELLLSENFSEYIEVVRGRSGKAGFVAGLPIIDLTGQSPGVLFALDAQNSGLPWLIGGYAGSNAMAVTALRSVPCQELSEAWILLEPSGPRGLDPKIVRTFGAEFPLDYEIAASWHTPPGAGGYYVQRKQILYRPSDVKSLLASCLLGK